MEAPFLNGIPYLSWEEESLARAAAVDKNELPDIGISIDDTESLQLLRRARYEIDLWDWQAQGDGAFLNIGPIGYGDPKRNERGFNGYQKRLVHQLVRAEYPHLVSISRPDFIQLLPYDKIREDAQLARKRQGVERTIAEQSGLRLVVESLCSNFKTGVLDEPTLPTDVKDERSGQGVQSPQEHVATTAITSTPSQQKKPMLVGHNLFLDLIFIYECFFGTLPDRVEQFQANLASIFSMIVDTKYLADIINENSPRYKSSLEEIDEELSKIASPVIEIPEDFSKYAGSPRLHEAGFDSFLTARVFIRLSSKIGGQERQVHSAETDTDTNGTIPKEAQSLEKTGDFGIDSSLKSEHLSFSNDPDMIQFYNHFRNLKVEEPASERNLVMPLPNSEFWATFGNRLRVNGTLEDVCRIGRPFDRPMSTSYPSTGQIPGGWVP
ncbi:uncharacterized protein KY384_003123 [Bacidia gigantensis]|uniref:uncharacterized protein n=1 Tax=Bacidia gigantensis TaxID=2732470 RepID=UPI001D05569A|nr:uncharacterized protein KY384_003123 [Bacidia gigantensis]KAG8531494.1 hypothetical protein KY384_003123 [Bacidia gigantensis]